MQMPEIKELRKKIEELYAQGSGVNAAEARPVFEQFRAELTAGKVRSAEKDGANWRANAWVKQGILLGFRIGQLAESGDPKVLSFIDKDTYPARNFRLSDKVRIVPGGVSVREGAYVAPGVVCMPPSYINVGAYVDEGTMVDSHALVGSCAQIGKRVHISAASQIGGVLEPVNATPVIVEDDVLIGGNCGIYEGTQIGAKAVIASGVTLTRGTPIYDVVRGEIIRPDSEGVLKVPADAVVVPGSRAISKGKAAEWGLSVYTPVIVKYRDEKTDLATALEGWLR